MLAGFVKCCSKVEKTAELPNVLYIIVIVALERDAEAVSSYDDFPAHIQHPMQSMLRSQRPRMDSRLNSFSPGDQLKTPAKK